MAAPENTSWGSIAGDYGRVGICVTYSDTETTRTVTVSTWFWSKYSVDDTNNGYYYNANATAATTLIGAVTLKTTVDTGGWSTSNQVKLGQTTYTYLKGASSSKKKFAVKLTGVDRVGATMTHTVSHTVPALASYKVAYYMNDGSNALFTTNQLKYHGMSLTLISMEPTRTGYSFLGWGTSSTATSVAYAPGATYTGNAALNLYAVWKPNEYAVKYNANGGTNAPANQTKKYGISLTLSTATPTRENYDFLGWATTSTATTATYAPGATYTSNTALNLYAVWLLSYVKPRITNEVISRCSPITGEDGSVTGYEPNEEGLYANVAFDWECDREVTEIKIEWESSVAPAVSKTVTASGTSGSVNEVIGDGTLSTDSTYVIRIFVTDMVDFSKVVATLNGENLPIDILIDEDGPKGISFGKPAELEGMLDSNYTIYPRKGFSNILLEPETDLNTVVIPNTYIGENTSTYAYVNCPIDSGTFTMEVASGGKDGQVFQRLTVTKKTDFTIWERFYYGGTWGDWYKEYDAQGTLLASPSWYMTEGHTVNLSQKISEQPVGIVLIFSLYSDGEAKNSEFFEMFIPKYMAIKHPGVGHNFNLCGMFGNGVKYLYIYDDRIVGHASNGETKTIGGIEYTNNRYVLRYVIGV